MVIPISLFSAAVRIFHLRKKKMAPFSKDEMHFGTDYTAGKMMLCVYSV